MSALLETKQTELEAVGPAFTREKMLEMRSKTRGIINQIAASVRPGMVEEDAVEMAKGLLAAQDMTRGWHDVYVRFGSNTRFHASQGRKLQSSSTTLGIHASRRHTVAAGVS